MDAIILILINSSTITFNINNSHDTIESFYVSRHL